MARLKNDYGFPATAMMANGKQLYMAIMGNTKKNLKKLVAELAPPDAEFAANARGQDPLEFVLNG